jgi:hypothetical protein
MKQSEPPSRASRTLGNSRNRADFGLNIRYNVHITQITQYVALRQEMPASVSLKNQNVAFVR